MEIARDVGNQLGFFVRGAWWMLERVGQLKEQQSFWVTQREDHFGYCDRERGAEEGKTEESLCCGLLGKATLSLTCFYFS